eukprot:CAMPEP_0197027158 /NCGR_PEP_ID=MMETSP1384-20130603/7115_1 /TAXON_ID=29189 /ORGANISM="Ammonia sp." /LENGTH=476 /DNA_ID=CAMNT_0042455957 /DNA_START=35 /DNA_END=1465 /DNA_ORIENTATION=-
MAQAKGVGIQTNLQNVGAIQYALGQKGIKSTMEQKPDSSVVIRYSVPLGQLANVDELVQSVIAEQNVDDSDIKWDHSIPTRIVEMDMKLAMQQVSNVKFSHIDNMIAPELGMDKLEQHKISDIDTMQEFFNITLPTPTSPTPSKAQQTTDALGIDGDDQVEKWWFQQTSTLRHKVEAQFEGFAEEFELIAINLLYNSKHTVKFIRHKGYEDAALMFHGAKQEDMGSIFQTGFRFFPGKSIGSLYGKGHYFTPQALHAIRYLEKCKGYRNQKQFSLIAAFVNPGKVKTIEGHKARNKAIADGYDSHYARVTDGVTKLEDGVMWIGQHINKHAGYTGDVMEEYAVKDGTRILPRFFITLRRCEKVFVWRDKNIANKFNGNVLKELKERVAIYGVTESQRALQLIRKKMSYAKNKVFVITNGADDGEGFVSNVRNELKLDTDILVFCGAVDWHSKWANKFKNVEVKCGKKYIVSFIENH